MEEFEILLNFRGLDLELYKKSKEVLYKATNKIKNIAKEKAPVDNGMLRKSIRMFPLESGADEYFIVDGVDYGIHVEYGTLPHIILPKNAKVLRFETDKKGRRGRRQGLKYANIVFAKWVKHPGTKEQPFFRPALHEVEKYWLDRIRDDVFSKK
ncbi:MAG: HK97 gp10 family phage protein [Spirochaetia bacterium]|nr:HK97 gp10 family phage protein [Spirochaetia bacterium]